MIRSVLLTVAVGFVGLSSGLHAQGTAKVDLAKGQQIATQICAACHGSDGNSAAAANPHLAGQPAEYITRQLRHFKQGLRKNEIMAGMVANLSDADMRALGAYYEQQKPKPGSAKDVDLVRTGQGLYRGGDASRGVPACAGCHSPNGAGIPANYPRLAGQFADYTYAQLKAFHGGQRGVDKEGRDTNGKIMAQIAAKLSDAEMRSVAEYVSGLN
jgi:cytochrome c553